MQDRRPCRAEIVFLIGVTLAWAVVDYGARIIVEFGFWAYSWGAGGAKADQIANFAELGFFKLYSLEVASDQKMAKAGALLISLVLGLVELVTFGFVMSFFWCVAGAIYLLLRQDVDDKELDDVYVPAETSPPHGPLPTAATPPPEPTPAPVPTTDVAPQSEQRLVETVQAPPQ